MIYWEYYKYRNTKATGIFLTREREYRTLIGGSHPKFQPIVSEIWDILGIKFPISKRTGVRLELDTEYKDIVAYTLTRGLLKDSTSISFDDMKRYTGRLAAFKGCDDIIDMHIIRAIKDTKEVCIVFAYTTDRFFICVNSDVGAALNELCLKYWDLFLVSCDYTNTEVK